MANIPITFTKGQSEAVDPKLLPEGLFLQAQNVRYRKDGRLGFRYGYDFDATSGHPTPANVLASAALNPTHLVSVTARPAYNIPVTATRLVKGVYSPTDDSPPFGDFASCELVRKWFSVRNITNTDDLILPSGDSAGCTDCTVTGSTITCPAGSYTVGTNTSPFNSGQISLTQLNTTTGLGPPNISPTANGNNYKTVTISGVTCVFYANSFDQVKMIRLDTNAVNVVVTAAAGQAGFFDVSSTGDPTECLLVYPNAAGSVLSIGRVDVAGTLTPFASGNIVTTGAVARPSVCASFNLPLIEVVVVWNDGATFTTGNVKVTVYNRTSHTYTTATTTVDASGRAVGYPVVGPHLTRNWVAGANISPSSVTDTVSCVLFDSTTTGSRVPYGGMSVASKPFNTATGNYIVMVDRDTDAADPANYYLVNTVNAFPAAFAVPYNVSDAQYYQNPVIFASTIAKRADASSTLSDPRRKVVSVPAINTEPGLTAYMCFLPIAQDTRGGYAAFLFEQGAYANVSSATLNDTLYFSGSRVTQYDGSNFVPVGFAGIPQIITATSSVTTPGVGPGTFEYVAVWTYIDRNGFEQRSPPSLPFSITLASTSAVTVYITNPMWGVYPSNNIVSARLYRTIDSGETFQEILLSPQSQTSLTLTTIFNDFTTDAQLLTRPALYTQGERGGLSGIHQDDAPPSARFLCAGSSRLFLGGMENPSQVQWSKLQFDGEPMTFANDPQWRATVDDRVTGVAEQDGLWYVFTKNAIWTVSGDGPDDNGAGAFGVPVRQPSDTGCISHKSIIRTGQGLFFQSLRGLEILPRGGNTPQWIGQAVRDTLALFPYVSATAFNQAELVCYWAVTDTAGSTGRLIVYDIRIGEWYVDNFYNRAIKTLAVYNGKLVIDGDIFETAVFTDDDTGAKADAIVPTLTTGDVRAFGMNGWGRYRKVQLEGEARDVSVAWSVTMDVSYDSGKTFTTEATWTRANITAAIGDAIEGAEHFFLTQKTPSIRLRFSVSSPSPTEGLIFNGLTLEVFPQGGIERKANNMRAQ